MIAHGPKPVTARDTEAAAPTRVAMIVRSSRLLQLISRVSSAACVCPSAEITKLQERTAKRGITRGLEKNAATTGERATPRSVRAAPPPTLIQKTVERSSSETVFLWM